MAPTSAEYAALAEVHQAAGPPARPAPGRLGFSEYDREALLAFAGGDPIELERLVCDARSQAEALAGPDSDGARVRLASRCLAAARTQQRICEALLGERLAKRDAEGVRLVARVLDSLTRKVDMLIRALQAEAALRRRPVVFVGHANEVSVGRM